jgi:tetratricopeptide (TPR) repeat protein
MDTFVRITKKYIIITLLVECFIVTGYSKGETQSIQDRIIEIKEELSAKTINKRQRKKRLLRLELAELLADSENYDEAINEYELLLEHKLKKKRRAKILGQKGICHEKIQQYDGALDSFQEAILLSPKDSVNHLNLAQVFEKLNLTEEAIESYEKVIKFKGNNFEAYYGLGRINRKLGLNSKALNYYQKAIEINSGAQDPEIYRKMSKCYESLGNWAISISMLEKVISIKPCTEDYIQLSFLYSMQNQYDRTIEILLNLLKQEPNREDIMLHLASAYLKSNRNRQAIDMLETTIKLYPENALAHFLMSIGLYSQNEIKSAKEQLNKSNMHAKSSILKNLNKYFLEYLGKIQQTKKQP